MSSIVLHSGESFERVFLNEPGLDLHITQESGSRVRIHLINCKPSESGNTPSDILNRITVEQAGEGCSTEIYALAWLHGDDRVATETHVHHAVGGGTSNQLVKFVLDDASRGHFLGRLLIAPGAQQTEAHQTNRNLVLSPEAEMRTQPQLEIYADDVQATHGASTGQLDEAALFYMRQRGIGEKKARQLLVGAFIREVIDSIGDTALRESLLRNLDL